MPPSVRWSRRLLETGASEPGRKNEDEIFMLARRRISHSYYKSLALCPRQYYLTGPGTWNGWFPDAPATVQRAYARKRLDRAIAHYGKRLHELADRLDSNDIDREFPERGIRAVDEDRIWQRFEEQCTQDWLQSKSMTLQKFLKRRDKKSIYLLEHATGFYNESNDERNRVKMWEWVRRGAKAYLEHRVRIREGIPISGWLVIEGRQLENGRIVRKIDDKRPERELREEKVYPSAVLDVNGEAWEYGYTLDRFFFDARTGFYYIVDLKTGISIDSKTGKPKAHDRLQLRSYGALLCRANPEITHENLVLRLAYLGEEPERIIHDDRFESKEAVDKALEGVRQQCREYGSRLTPFEDVSAERLLELYPRSKVLDANGRLILPNFPVGTVVALPENFPPEAAQRRDINACRQCDKRVLCDEGQELMTLQWRE